MWFINGPPQTHPARTPQPDETCAAGGLVDLRPSSGRLAGSVPSPGVCHVREAEPHEPDTPPDVRRCYGGWGTDVATVVGLARRVHRSGWRVARARSEEVANRRRRLELPRRWRLTHGELFTPDTKKSPIDERRVQLPRPVLPRPPDPPLLHRCRSIPPPTQGGTRSAPPQPAWPCHVLTLAATIAPNHRLRLPSRSLAQYTAQTHATTHLVPAGTGSLSRACSSSRH
jgi:hypothetical protein